VITSINMGFIVIFFYKRRENKETAWIEKNFLKNLNIL
jgi:hypothetical protein